MPGPMRHLVLRPAPFVFALTAAIAPALASASPGPAPIVGGGPAPAGQWPDTVRRAGAALARLFEEEESWPELRDVVRRQAEWADDATARRQALCRVALLEEERLGDLDAAIAAWRQVLADDPDHAEAHAALDRLLTTRGRWPELIDLIRQGLDRAEPAAAKASLLRIAQLQEQRLAAPGEAVAALREVLDRDGDDDHALAELARLVRAADRPSELVHAAINAPDEVLLRAANKVLASGRSGSGMTAPVRVRTGYSSPRLAALAPMRLTSLTVTRVTSNIRRVVESCAGTCGALGRNESQ